MSLSYVLTPFAAWFIAGCTKFLINSLKSGELSFSQIGYGGLPSNHSAIVSSATALVAIREGVSHPAFGIGLAFAFIVMLDANSLRRKVGQQAEVINQIAKAQSLELTPLRERMGHTRLEIMAGIVVGILTALMINAVPL